MPHSVTPEVEDAAMPDAAVASPDTDPGSASPVKDAEQDGSDKENRVKLEDMFDDDSEDEEFASSAPQQPETRTEQPSAPIASGFSDPQVMRAFYQRLFPFRYLFQWLNHSPSPTTDFGHREFAFTLPNDAYLRYQSFPTADTLRKQCMTMTPSRFEIGPVYSTNPRDRKTLRKASMFRPISKELVFDVDLTDYDPIRTCCNKANICLKCWQFITMSIKVVDTALREDFGFKHIMWVYSGRRGAHAWVCDKRAREMDDAKRRAIAGYLELVRGGDKSGKKINVRRPLHPHLERSLKQLRSHFQTDILVDQDPFLQQEQVQSLLKTLPDTQLQNALQKKWDSAPNRSSTQKWADIKTLAEAGDGSANLKDSAIREAREDVILEYTYPRLDAEVSKKLNHLLKSPFCVHPGTGRVCVPIDVRKADEFDPLAIPTVTQLLNEIDTWDAEHGSEASNADAEGERKLQDWEKTSLKPYVELFRGFVATLLKDEKSGKREREEGVESMEF